MQIDAESARALGERIHKAVDCVGHPPQRVLYPLAMLTGMEVDELVPVYTQSRDQERACWQLFAVAGDLIAYVEGRGPAGRGWTWESERVNRPDDVQVVAWVRPLSSVMRLEVSETVTYPAHDGRPSYEDATYAAWRIIFDDGQPLDLPMMPDRDAELIEFVGTLTARRFGARMPS